ncbi:hypothetical protein CI109_105697 [Kwoniella shandongensis]|uniref:Uncharacterized protein n=1 Tax=Kwoniella shandongensis TaxID=1734106 RepID=A0A5M6C031_9TREE|nr:uncharacterized protein CI109_003038 [Kwoniella shandongensis]KAA5528506.1 hypothetical protein CI109_003038 [Kwoniella shandongensis]
MQSSPSGPPRISIFSSSSSSSPETSLSGWLSNLRSTKYSLLPTSSSGAATPNLEPLHSGGGHHHAAAGRRRRLFQASALAFAVIVIAGLLLHGGTGTKQELTEEIISVPAPKTTTTTIITVPEPVTEPYDEDPSELSPPPMDEDETTTPSVPTDDEDTEKPPPSVDMDGKPWGKLESGELIGEEEEVEDMWGWTEEMGWRHTPGSGLTYLGQVAESAYRLHITKGEQGMKDYFRQLYDFAVTLPMRFHSPFLSSIHTHLPPDYPNLVPDYPEAKPTLPAMINYKQIHQTDKKFDESNPLIKLWQDMNGPDGWTLNFLDDDGAGDWVDKYFARSDIEWAWKYMHRGVLRADFLRYLLPLVKGGVYSDVDTRPLRPIEQWGLIDVEYLNVSATDGPFWRSKLSTHPSVVVAIDVDVHAYENWQGSWPRPLGICQWTLSSAPNHPIFIDAARRVVNSTKVVQEWETWKTEEIERLEEEKEEGWEKTVKELGEQGKDHAMSVMEWTGPGLFTDSVMAYILARYNVTWHRLRGLDHPLRIGDVLIMPITAFSPGGERDFRAEGKDSPQANVEHDFRGSWKQEGAR